MTIQRMKPLRFMTEQWTNAELRQRLRHGSGLGLVTAARARELRMMTYGVLKDRARRRIDRRLTADGYPISSSLSRPSAVPFAPAGAKKDKP